MGKEFDGITVEGQSVEKYLSDQDPQEVIEPNKHYLKRRGKVKYMEHKENHGPVTTHTQMALNKTNLKANFAKSKINLHQVIALLITGETITSKTVTEHYICARGNDAAYLLRKVMKSVLGEYISMTLGPKNIKCYTYAGHHKFSEAIADANTRRPDPISDTPHPRATTAPENTSKPEVVTQDVHIRVRVTFKIDWEI